MAYWKTGKIFKRGAVFSPHGRRHPSCDKAVCDYHDSLWQARQKRRRRALPLYNSVAELMKKESKK
jgi:hypothetical protein